MPPIGHIAFVSQSGALCGGVIDWTIGRGIGFSRLLSVGNEADVNETDLLPFLTEDATSRVIALYLEDVKGGPAFVDALRQAASRKPVLALKAGRTTGGQIAAASHTGALASSHAAFRAACQQTGVIEVESIQALFDGALALAYQPLPAGARIALLTNAGGPAALAADTLEGAGLSLARTSPETQARLRSFLAADAQVGGPVDMLGGAHEDDYHAALQALLADPAVDGVLVSLAPHVLVNPVAVVEAFGAVAAAQPAPAKPVLACLMGEASLDEAFKAAHAAQLPAYTFPEDAVAAFGMLWQRARWVRRGHGSVGEWECGSGGAGERGSGGAEEPEGRGAEEQRGGGAEGRITQHALRTTHYASNLLAAYGITTPPEALATNADETAACGRQIGFPVVLKLVSPDILHKTDVGGVILNVQDEAAARAGFETLLARAAATHPAAVVTGVQVQKMIRGGQEVIVGVKRDATFGPLLMFGLGGIYVETLRDVSFRLAPLTSADAAEMIEEVRSAKLLAGVRGAPPADRPALIEAIVRIGQLAAEHPEIAELDVNPLLVLPAGQGAVAVDVRIILD